MKKGTDYGLGFEDLNDEDVEKMGRDPFLIAYALADPVNRVVVSNEGSKPNQTRPTDTSQMCAKFSTSAALKPLILFANWISAHDNSFPSLHPVAMVTRAPRI